MALFGRYEVVDELASRGPFTVYSARIAGQPGPVSAAIKAFRTADEFADPELIEQQASSFLESAQLQKELAQGGRGWAPVHETGRTATHAFYVTDLYPDNAQRIVDQRRDLIPSAIADIIAGVCDALEVLYAHAGQRGHGAIRPGNVLLRPRTDDGGLEGAEVVLIDPVPPSRAEQTSHDEDLRQLSDLLHHLVTHRPAPRGGAVQRGPEWTRFGEAGELLRQLCESLLNPHPGEEFGLREVRERLEAIRRAPSGTQKSRTGLYVVVAVVLLAAVGAGGYLFFGRGGAAQRGEIDERTRYLSAEDPPSKWLVEDEMKAESLLADIDRSLASGAGLPEDDVERGRLVEELAALREKITRLREEVFPSGTSPQVVAHQKEFNERVRGAEGAMRELRVRLDVLKGRLPEVKAGEDPRVPEPMSWASVPQGRLVRVWEELQRELSASGPQGDEKLENLRPRVEDVIERLGKLRGLPWDPYPGETADPEKARLRVAHQQQVAADATKIIEELNALRQSCEGALGLAREWLIAWIDEQRASRPEASDELIDAYGDYLNHLERRARERKIGWADAKAEVARVREWVGMVEKKLPARPEPPVLAGLLADVDRILSRFDDERREEARTLSAPIIEERRVPQQGEGAYADLVEERTAVLRQRADKYTSLLAACARIESLSSDAYGPTETPGDGESMVGLKATVESLATELDLEVAVQKAVDRVTALEQVEKLSSPEDLLRAMNDVSRGGTGQAWVAWRRLLATGYPRTVDELSAMAEQANGLLVPALSHIRDARRRSELTKRVSEDLRTAWHDFIRTKSGTSHVEVDRVFREMGRFGIGENDVKDGEAWLRFNYERWKLIEEVERGVTASEKEGQVAQIMPIAGRFVERWKQEYDLLKGDGLQSLRKQMMDMAAGKIVDLREEGPGRVGWKGEPAPDGSEVTYSGRGHTLRFVKVKEDADKASFLCTTEVSLRLFVDLIEEAKGWENLRSMGPKGGESQDGRKGPVVWRWWSDRGGQMEPNPPQEGAKKSQNGNGWFTQPPQPMGERGYYPAGLQAPTGEPAAPSWDSPMTYVTPQAALFAASWMGCRLPTADEWREARKLEGETAAVESNRRDMLWKQQFDYILALRRENVNGALPFSGAKLPNGDIVRALGADRRPPAQEQDSQPAVDRTDGWLWFRPVADGGGRLFRHLEGNVAEWVYENALGSDSLLRPDFKTVEGVMGRRGEGLGVIGASALSPQEYAPEEVIPSAPPGAGTAKGFSVTQALGTGFSDVGFRLAFTTGAGGGAGLPKDRLLSVLRGTPYLSRQ
jgi:hypothetical protein